MKKRLLALILMISCLTMTGCNSLLFGINLNDAVVKNVDYRAKYNMDDISKQVDSYGSEKYDIGGTDAFYVLPNGLPEPDSIIDFKMIDFIDNKTMIYAYQSLYKLSDSTGRGGKAKKGTRPLKEGRTATNLEGENLEDKSPWVDEDEGDDDTFDASDVTQMVTIIMSYDTSTGDYNVFGSFVNDVEVNKVKTATGTNTYIYMQPDSTGVFGMTQTGMTYKETNPLITQKVNDGYLLYHWGNVYLFKESGACFYQQDLRTVQAQNSANGESSRIFPDDAMIDNVFMDNRYHLYVQCSYPEKTSGTDSEELNTDAYAEQSEDEVEDAEADGNLSGTNSVLYIVSSVNLGYSGQDTDSENYHYFYSSNENFDVECQNIQSYGGYNVRFDGEPDQETIDSYFSSLQDSFLSVHEYRPSFSDYRFSQEAFPYKLYVMVGGDSQDYIQENGMSDGSFDEDGRFIRNDGKEELIYEFRPDNLQQWTDYIAGSDNYRLFAFLEEKDGSRQIAFLQKSESAENLIDSQNLVTEDVTVSRTAYWYDEDNEVQSETITGTIHIPKEYRITVNSTSYPKVKIVNEPYKVSPSLTDGYMELATYQNDEIPANYENLVKTTYPEIETDENGKAITSLASLSKKVEDSGDDSQLLAENLSSVNTTSIDYFPTVLNETGLDVMMIDRAGTNLQYYVLQSDKTLTIFFDHYNVVMVNIPMLMFDTYGDIMNIDYSQPEYDEESDITDRYLEAGLKLVRGTKDTWWLYAASPEKGLLKLNLNNCKLFQHAVYYTKSTKNYKKLSFYSYVVRDKKAIAENSNHEISGQISSYPYYGVWVNEGGEGCYAVGFQTTAYTYNMSDLCGAKLYYIDFSDDEVAVNLAYSAARKNDEFQKAYADGDAEACKNWLLANVETIGIIKSPATIKTLTGYFEFLGETMANKKKAYNSFTSIVSKELKDTKALEDSETVWTRLEECQATDDLERYMVELRSDLVEGTLAEDPIKRQQEIAESINESDVGEGTKASEETPIVSDDGEITGTVAPITDQEKETYEQNQTYFTQKDQVIKKLKELNGYTDDDQWTADLQTIVDSVNPSTTYSTYEDQVIQKRREQASKTVAEQKQAEEEQAKKEEELINELNQKQAEQEAESQKADESLSQKESQASDKLEQILDSVAEASSLAVESSIAEVEASKAAESRQAEESANRESQLESRALESLQEAQSNYNEESRRQLESEYESMREAAGADETLDASTELEDQENSYQDFTDDEYAAEETLP